MWACDRVMDMVHPCGLPVCVLSRALCARDGYGSSFRGVRALPVSAFFHVRWGLSRCVCSSRLCSFTCALGLVMDMVHPFEVCLLFQSAFCFHVRCNGVWTCARRLCVSIPFQLPVSLKMIDY